MSDELKMFYAGCATVIICTFYLSRCDNKMIRVECDAKEPTCSRILREELGNLK